nr:UPF0175 family protein [Candidatus Freyarchaeota archaeon]
MSIEERIMKGITDIEKYIILLAQAYNSTPIKGKLWLQKEMFLISHNLPDLEEECDYEEDLLGPFSENLDAEFEQLEKVGILEYENNKIILTKLGKEIAPKIEVDEKCKEMIEEIKSLLNDMTEDELLAFIYFSYPEMAGESVKFDKKIKPRRKELALSLYKKRKISLGKTAQIAGISIEELIKELKSKGITVYQ